MLARRVAHVEEARQAAAFGLVGVDREACRSCSPPGWATWYWQPPSERFIQVSTMSKVSGACDADRRVQRRGRVPGLVAHAGHVLADGAGGLQRQRAAVAGDHVAAVVEAGHAHLDALQRRVHIAHGAAGRAFLAHHMPGLERVAQRQLDAARLHLADQREAELEVRREPGHVERRSRPAHVGDARRRSPSARRWAAGSGRAARCPSG